MRRTCSPRVFAAIALGCLALALPAEAGVTVRFDEAAINELLPALAPRQVELPLAGRGSVGVRLDDLRVVGFEPVANGTHPGYIRTALKAVIPALGLTAPLEPRLSLRLEGTGAARVLRLRFEQIPLKLPLAGSIDLAPFVEPMDFPVASFHEVDGVPDPTEVRSTLSSVKMEPNAIRFEFDVDVVRVASGS
jgi:hypothetical protein